MSQPISRVTAVTLVEEDGQQTGGVRNTIEIGIADALADAITRVAAIGSLVGIALIHALRLPPAFDDAGYLGGLFIAAAAAAVVLAAVLARTTDVRAWAASGGLALLILIGYVLSRTSGLPSATGDIGEWDEPLGLVSLVVEGTLVCLSAAVLATRRSLTP